MDDVFAQKKPNTKHICYYCDYKSSNKRDYERHLLTGKHKRMTQELHKDDENGPNLNKYICNCGSKYKYRQGLWKHKQICENQHSSKCFKISQNSNFEQIKVLTELVKDVVRQNQDVVKQNIELTNKMADICSKPNTISNISNSNIHSNNKTFNLQFFLNDTCKEAMNMSDFVNQVQVSISELEEIGELGYADGISKIIIKNLNEICYTYRPIHCSDSKREVLYIKEDNKWFKEDESNGKISKAIKQIAHKNIKQIPEWVKLHPDCHDSESKQNDKYLQIVSNSMSGGTEIEQKTNINKIISKIAKEVIINKQYTD